MRDYSVTEVRASIMFQGCLDFLTMCSTHKGRQFTPSKEVDDAWHTFLLYSRAYAGFCAALGSRLWHEPNDGHEPHVGGYAMTLQFMREHAIVHDPRLWQPHAMAADSVPDPSTCGSD